MQVSSEVSLLHLTVRELNAGRREAERGIMISHNVCGQGCEAEAVPEYKIPILIYLYLYSYISMGKLTTTLGSHPRYGLSGFICLGGKRTQLRASFVFRVHVSVPFEICKQKVNSGK